MTSAHPASAVAARTGSVRRYDAVKRILDVLVSGVLLLLTLPLSIYATLQVWLEDRGPVLYRARRVGRHGRDFTMLKFRTMVLDAERLGGSSTATTDPRLTRAGRRLRRWKLDEVPQLVNVIRGDMSLVGPRPQVRWDVDRYTAPEQALLEVRPGITDWASIRFSNEGEILAGHEDPDAAYDLLIRPEKMTLALKYVEQRSLRTDIGILIRTAAALFSPPQQTLQRASDAPDRNG